VFHPEHFVELFISTLVSICLLSEILEFKGGIKACNHCCLKVACFFFYCCFILNIFSSMLEFPFKAKASMINHDFQERKVFSLFIHLAKNFQISGVQSWMDGVDTPC